MSGRTSSSWKVPSRAPRWRGASRNWSTEQSNSKLVSPSPSAVVGTAAGSRRCTRAYLLSRHKIL